MELGLVPKFAEPVSQPHSPLSLSSLLCSQSYSHLFFKGCHHTSGSFIYSAHVTSLTCKANVQSINTSHTWIDIVYTNHKRKGRFAGTESQTCDLPTQIVFDLRLHLPYRIWPFSWLHTVRPKALLSPLYNEPHVFTLIEID